MPSAKNNGSDSKNGRKKPTFIEQARRKQILEVAAELFSEKGFNGTSIEEIAEKVGVSRGVIFYYFEGKGELGEETVMQGLRNYGNFVQDRMAARDGAKDKLLEFVDACLDYTSEHRQDYLMFADALGCFGSSDDRYRVIVRANRKSRELLVRLIEEGQAAGELGEVDATEFADIVQGFVDGMMELNAVEPGQIDLPGCKRLFRKMMLSVI